MKTIYSTDKVFKPAKGGATQQWQGFVGVFEGSVPQRVGKWTEYGQVGGTITTSEPTIVQGKNIGKANETKPEAQAISELKAELAKKLDKGYAPEGMKYEGMPLPMLAQKWAERKHTLKWPVLIQPKLDGVRALTDGKRFWSRTGKFFEPDITPHLMLDPTQTGGARFLDGELMLPKPSTFQEIAAYTKKARPDQQRLEHWIYDAFWVNEPNLPYTTRYERLQALSKSWPKRVLLVPTIEVAKAEQVDLLHGTMIEQGFEGTMVRTRTGPYELSHRSSHLLKKKDFIDTEFRIVGFHDGDGKETGCIIYVCEVERTARTFTTQQLLSKTDGELNRMRVFRVRPRGTYDSREVLYQQGESIVGQDLTVRHQDYTDSGFPRIPVGISVRDYE